jgi:hypothetical protein
MMNRTITTIVALMAIAGTVAVSTVIQTNTVSAMDDLQFQEMWDTINGTAIDIGVLLFKIDHLNSSNFTILLSRLAEIKSSLTNVSKRMGYNSTFTIKSDFDKVLASLYTSNGTNRIEVINGNQLVLAHMEDLTYNKLQDTQTTVNQTKESVDASSITIGSYELNIQIILILSIVIIGVIVVFIIWYLRSRKGSVQEYRGQNESLFMPPPPPSPPQRPKPQYSQQEVREAEQGVDNLPDCFRIQYDSRANECRACGVSRECSGEPVKRQHSTAPPSRSRYVKQ